MPQSLRGDRLRIYLNGFGMDTAVALSGLAIQFYAVKAGMAADKVGYIGTAGATAYTLACLLGRHCSDRWGRKVIATFSLVSVTVCYVLAVLGAKLWVIIAVGPLTSALMALFWPAMQAWLSEASEASPRRLAQSLSAFNVFWSAGLMAGPVLAGLLFYRFGWQYPFLLAAAVTLVCSGIVLSMRAPQKEADAPPDPGSGSDAPPHAERWLRMAWYANFASWFIGGVVRALFPKIGHDLKYTEEISGYVIGCLSLAQMAMFAALRFTTRWQFRLMPLIGAQLVGVLGMVLALFAPGPIVFGLGFLLAGISTGVTYSCSQFYSLHGRQSGRAATAGLHEAILGSGAIFGPLLGGLAARFVSLRAPFAVAGLVILVAMALELLELRGMRAGGGTPLKWRGTPAEQADSVATPGGTT